MRQCAAVQPVVAEQLGRQHRYQGQCDETREAHGRRQRDAEFAEHEADIPRHERHRKNDGNQDQRRCDNREPYFTAAVGRCQQRGFAAFDAARDVFEHDDRVVDDKPDREHEAEHRQRVQ